VSPAAEGTEAYLSCLEQALDQCGARVLVTSHDGTIALLRRHRQRLEARVRIALAAEPAMTIAVSKERTLDIAQKLGLSAPRGLVIRAAGEAAAAVKEIGLPAVVKPDESWHAHDDQGAWVGPRLVTTPDEASAALAEVTAGGFAALLQQYLSGRREAVSFLYARGRVHARFAQWARRTIPPLGGASVLRQSVPVPSDIGVQAERLVREIELEGYSEVEFRRDGDGRPYLMEINPRLSASVEVAVRAGVDFPHLIYQWARGGPIDDVAGYRTGGWMRHLGGDIMTTIAALEERGRPGVRTPARAVAEFGLSFLKPMGYDYVVWDDPLPAFRATTGFARYALRRCGSRLRRQFS